MFLAVLGLSGCELTVNSWTLDWFRAWHKAQATRAARNASADADRVTRENAQLLREMFQVVLQREPSSPQEFAYFMNPLSQGGSIEGTYNGIVYSDFYHRLEEHSPPATRETQMVFSDELAALEKELPQASRSGLDADELARTPLLKLKRFLGNEALKVVEAKEKAGEPALADWYAKWTARVVGENPIDYGVAARGLADQNFHRAWASHAPHDRLVWEVLNRIHRVLNAAEARSK
jgi:hypothetical protein